jgi:RNA-directed DNA polymerase
MTLPTGPKASAGKPKSLCERVRSTAVLNGAWHAIRRNAETSQTAATKQAAWKFGQELHRNIRRIQDHLRKGYKFEKAYGATPPKGKGKVGKRPIVIAPLADRIVQRAILDVLQAAKELQRVQEVLSTPTSIGGIRDRGVDDAINLFDKCYGDGATFVAGSDISGFFTKIPRGMVLGLLRLDTDEAPFIALLDRALTVELSNADMLGAEDRKLFPTGTDGVAQGCPLSALAGNIVLEAFDRQMNQPGRGITCIRYIDDFILIGRSQSSVVKAMESAKVHLAGLGMAIYDPIVNPDKAFRGAIGEPHVFLGYEIVPGSYRPSRRARETLIDRVNTLLKQGRVSIRRAVKGKPLTFQDRCYAQTIAAVDNTVRGWRGSFRASLCTTTFEHLDREIERRLNDFEGFFRSHTAKCEPGVRRRALGVSLLAEK